MKKKKINKNISFTANVENKVEVISEIGLNLNKLMEDNIEVVPTTEVFSSDSNIVTGLKQFSVKNF